jgi:hypothetical protein
VERRIGGNEERIGGNEEGVEKGKEGRGEGMWAAYPLHFPSYQPFQRLLLFSSCVAERCDVAVLPSRHGPSPF